MLNNWHPTKAKDMKILWGQCCLKEHQPSVVGPVGIFEVALLGSY